MQKPGRSGDDSRPDRIDELAAQDARAIGVPADGEAAITDAVTGEPTEAPALSETFPDDLLLDPLLSDEPIDLAAVRADDALIDALGGGDLDAAVGMIDDDDPLIAMLAAWAASARPDEQAEPEPAPARPSLVVVGEHDAAHEVAEHESPEHGFAAAECGAPGLAAVVPLAGPAATQVLDRPTPAVVNIDSDEPADATPVPPPAVAASLDLTTSDDDAAVLRDTPPPVLGVLDRVRALRRRIASSGHSLPPGHPLRRAAVVFVVAALGVSGAAATGGSSRPGDPGFAMTRVFFAEQAKSLVAAEVVSAGLDRAREYLDQRQPALAARELAAVRSALPDVREEEGHTRLVDQQHDLAAAVALTPSIPADARLRTTPTVPDDHDRDTSVLAEAAPPVTTTSDTATDGKPEVTSSDAAPGAAKSGTGAGDVVTKPTRREPSTGSSTADTTTSAGSTSTSADDSTSSAGATSTVGGTKDRATATVGATPTGDGSGGTSGAGGSSGTGDDPTTTTVTRVSTPTSTSPTSSPTTSRPPPPTDAGAGDTGSNGGIGAGSVTVGQARPSRHVGASISAVVII